MSRKIRIEAEQRNRLGGDIIDQYGGKMAYFNRGEDVTFEIAYFANRRMLTRYDIQAGMLTIRTANGTVLMTTNINNADLSTDITAEQWRTGRAALARVFISATDSGALPAGFLTLEITGISGPTTSVYASGRIEAVTVPGWIPGVPLSPGPLTYYTQSESDLRYAPVGSGDAAEVTAGELQVWTGAAPGAATYGNFLKYSAQSLTNAEKVQVRTNIGVSIAGGLSVIPGIVSGTGNANAILDGALGNSFSVEPSGNPGIEIIDTNLVLGIPYIVRIAQGYTAKWPANFTFPPGKISCGNAGGGFGKLTKHIVTGEFPAYDNFEVTHNGYTIFINRHQETAAPLPISEWIAEYPFISYSGGFGILKDRASGQAMASTAGSPTNPVMAGSNFQALGYDGVSAAHAFFAQPFTIAVGLTIAMVFTATASTGQKCLFYSTGLGIQIVADTDGIRLQARDAASGTGILIGNAYSAAPVAFVAVIRPNSLGAYALSSDPTGGGAAGSFTPATGVSGGYVHFGASSTGTRQLACKIARCQIYRLGMTPAQARAVLDQLTEYYQIG